MAAELDWKIREALLARWQTEAEAEQFDELVHRLVAREISPAQAVARLLAVRKESV